jgi:hypothetical protein
MSTVYRDEFRGREVAKEGRGVSGIHKIAVSAASRSGEHSIEQRPARVWWVCRI